jgi:hypothetical protein
MLSFYLGFRPGVLPISGYCNFFDSHQGCRRPVQWAYHLVLPSITLSLPLAAIHARVVRTLAATSPARVSGRATATAPSEWGPRVAEPGSRSCRAWHEASAG